MSKRRRAISRRQFMRASALGAGALALPSFTNFPLLSTDTARARIDERFPKRFVVFFSPNGSISEHWSPTGSETSFDYGRILAPLEPHKEHVNVLKGLDIRILDPSLAPGDGHQQGMGQILTGTELLFGDTQGGCTSCPAAGLAGGISVDQRIANELFVSGRRSYEFGVLSARYENVWTRMVYRGANQALPPQRDPSVAWNDLFGGFDPGGTSEEEAARTLRRRRVVDHLQGRFQSFRDRVGQHDQRRIEQHIEALDDIALRLDDPELVQPPSCVVPGAPGTINPGLNDNFPMIGRLQMDMLVQSLACGITQVASLQWTQSVGNVTHSWLGMDTGHHSLSHEDTMPRADARELLTQINTWYAQQFAYLIQKMKDIPEGGGTMLDNTCIVWVNELGEGYTHRRHDIPIVTAGSAGGFLKTGRFMERERTVNDLWVTMCQAYGVETNTFGNASYCNGPMSELHS